MFKVASKNVPIAMTEAFERHLTVFEAARSCWMPAGRKCA
jgi:hypothetical protein